MPPHTFRRVPLFLLAAATLFSVACGGGSPTAPAGGSAAGVTLLGNVAGGVGSATTRLTAAGAATLSVGVVENPAINVAVGADGSFVLRGLPEGRFTLVFKLDGVPIASLVFDDVRPNQEIALRVALQSGTVVVLEEKRNGVGHGDLEIEGLVEQILQLDTAGESRFVIAGYTVVVRPGQSAIREGGRARSVTDVSLGRRVHVKGAWLSPDAKGQPVLALEIILQGPASGPAPTPAPTPGTQCPTGANTQVEGLIQSKGASSIVVRQQGKGDFQCEVSAGTRIRKGNTNYTFAQLQPGWRVHVSGAGLGGGGGLCRVAADEIKVQQD